MNARETLVAAIAAMDRGDPAQAATLAWVANRLLTMQAFPASKTNHVRTAGQAKRTKAGCCDRHADNQYCDCLDKATGTTGCGICNDPNCEFPNEKH